MSLPSGASQDRQQEEEAIQAFERQFGPDHEVTLAAFKALGDAAVAQGRLDEAEKQYMRALEGYGKNFGLYNRSILDIWDSLCSLYFGQGRLREAERMALASLGGYTQTRGRYDKATLYAANNLGAVYASQGKMWEAEKAYKQALEDMERAFGQENELTLTTANNLGLFYKDLNKFEEAEKMYEWAVRGFEKTLGRDSRLTLTTMNGLGMLRRRQGKLEEAETLFKQAMEGLEKSFGRDCTLTLDTVNNLGMAYADQGRSTEAEETYKRGLEGWERLHGWSHKSTLNTANNLRRLYARQGKTDKAEEVSKLVLEKSGGNRLHEAARNGETAVIAILLENGFPINQGSTMFQHPDYPWGCTAISVAVSNGNAVVARELLRQGADIEAVGWDPQTSLYIAARKNHLNIAHMLLDHGARVDGSEGFPPLVGATAMGHLDMVKLLLQRGACVDKPDADGDPALHTAAWNGHLDIVHLLLAHGADPRTKGGSGRTARWFASEAKHEAIVEVLKHHGADDKDRPDMPNDSSKTLQSIGIDRLLADIEKAQSLMFEDSIAEQWAQKLRFIIQAPGDKKGRQYDLELVEEEPGSTEPFVAVSYCWASVSASADNSGPLRVNDTRTRTDSTARGIRLARTRSDVILRSLAFAASQGIKRVWIDQECIDQDDEADMQVAVQSMHLVYQRATVTVAVLGRHVHTPEDISGLLDLLPRHGLSMPSDGLQACDITRDRTLGDKWFTRAWCTQEMVNSKSTYYMIGWRDGLDVDGQAWVHQVRLSNESPAMFMTKQRVCREWVISARYMWNMSWYNQGRHMDVTIGNLLSAPAGAYPHQFTLLDQDVEEKERHGQPTSALGIEIGESRFLDRRTPSLLQNYSAARQRMIMATACQVLVRRRNLLVSDRLAILSNMTQYRFRINTNKVVEQKLSFTACVMALALQNGDIRSLCFPLAGDSDDTPRIGGGNSIPGSWLPPPDFSIHALACGRQVAGLASPGFGGDAGYVIGKKGLFCGLIWEIEAYHADDFADVAEALPELLELATDGHSEESGLWLKATLQVLIRHFISAGNLELAELVIICALERQFKDPDEAHVLLSRAESWVKDGDDESWPDELHSLPPGRHELGPGLPPLGPFDGSRPVLHWICNQIAANKPLPVGKCVLPSDGGGESGTVLGLFAVDPARHRKVFTPLNGLEYEFGTTAKGRLFARYQFAAVEERVGNRPSDEDTRKAMNLLRGGRDVPLDPKAYCVQRSVSGQAVWSQRLSRNGILVKNDGDSWTTIPLGQDGFYSAYIAARLPKFLN